MLLDKNQRKNGDHDGHRYKIKYSTNYQMEAVVPLAQQTRQYP